MRHRLGWAVCMGVWLISSGCAAVAIAGAGALGGYAASKDTIRGTVDVSEQRLWDASIKAVDELGEITGQDREAGLIIAMVENSEIRVKVEPMTDKSSQLSVKSRKNLLPNLSLAEEIFSKIFRTAR